MGEAAKECVGRRRAAMEEDWIGLDLFQVTMQLFRISMLNWVNV